MKFDQKAPTRLTRLQVWFAEIITQKMLDDRSIQPTTSRGNSLVDEAKEFITETPTLSAIDRLQLYNQSYWLRLFDALHEEYPLLTSLFGTEGFDTEIAIPYLLAHPPSHWSLNEIGKELVTWLEANYVQDDKRLIMQAAHIDWACQQSFFAKGLPPIDLEQYTGQNAEKLLARPLILQPHVHLFETWGHFMHFREAFLKEEPDYWLEHDFPELVKNGPYFFLIYRTPKLSMAWDELTQDEFYFLSLFKRPTTIDEAIQALDVNEDDPPFWIQRALLKQLLAIIS